MPVDAAGATTGQAGTGAGAGAGAGATGDTGAGKVVDAGAAAGAGAGAGADTGKKYDWSTVTLEADDKAWLEKHQWSNPGEVIRSHMNLQKITSVPADRLLKIPNDKSTPEEWNDYHTKLGRPATAADYKLPVPEGDKGEFAKMAQDWFHEAGISAGSATKIATKWNGHVAAQMKAATEARAADTEKQMGELKTEWGADFEKFSGVVDNAAKQFGVSTDQLGALKYALGYKGAMKFMQSIGAKVGTEGEFISPDKGGGMGGDFTENMTAEQAQSAINTLKKDRAFIEQYNSKTDPKARGEARAKMDRLSRLAGPGFTTFQGPAQ